jgi:hypothetical protein
MDERKAYEEKLDAQLKEWSAQIALLRAKADKAKAEVKVEYYKMIETLQGKQETARMKLEELRTAGDDRWEDYKTGGEETWAEIKAAFQEAVSKLE